MSTSAGLVFRINYTRMSSSYERKILTKCVEYLDEITNANGLGVACTPWLSRDGNDWIISAQTHWSYDGSNGRVFIKELKNMLRKQKIKIKIKEWYYK